MKSTLKSILQTLLPQTVVENLQDHFYKRKNPSYKRLDRHARIQNNEEALSRHGISAHPIKDALSQNELSYDDNRLSWHYHLFAGFAANANADKEKLNILEVGTFDGDFAKFLSKNFPKSTITTLDLPQNDDLFISTNGREDIEARKEHLRIRTENISQPNIHFIEMNSLDLLDRFEENSFDLIWLDGDHLDPQVTIDITNCLRLIKDGGYLCVDDVVRDHTFPADDYVSNDSYKTLEHFESAGCIKNEYLFKRCVDHSTIFNKYISYGLVKKNLSSN